MVLIYFKKYLFESLTIIFNYSGTTASYLGEQVKNTKNITGKLMTLFVILNAHGVIIIHMRS